jgi:hypothetical protein
VIHAKLPSRILFRMMHLTVSPQRAIPDQKSINYFYPLPPSIKHG